MTIEVFTPRWKELLSKLFTSRGGRGGPLVVLDDVMPVVQLVDPTQAELHYPRAELSWGYATTTTGGAAQGPTLTIKNPPGSGKLLVIEDLTLSGPSVAMTIALSISVSTGGGTTAFSMDTRAGLNLPLPQTDTTALVPIVLPCLFAVFMQAGAAPLEVLGVDRAIVLQPGFELRVVGSAVNQTFNIGANGYVRPLDPSET